MVQCQLLLKQWVPGLLSDHFDLVFSEYPTHRSKKDSEGVEMGVAGSVSLLQNVTLSTQPVSSLDWSPDKRGLCICSSFDQTVRVLIVTKLQTIWPSALNWTFPRGCSQNCAPFAPSFLTEDIGSECWLTARAQSQSSSSFPGCVVAWLACCCGEGATQQGQLCSFPHISTKKCRTRCCGICSWPELYNRLRQEDQFSP